MRGDPGAILRPPLVRKNLIVAAVVGTVLTAINQFEGVFLGEEISLVKLLLTYCVPFLVASYGSYNALR